MDFDERDFLDADEEYEMMYADELEIMKEMEQEVQRNEPNSRKLLNFNNVPLVPNSNAPSTSKETPESTLSGTSECFTCEAMPSTSKNIANLGTRTISKESPLPSMEFDKTANEMQGCRILVHDMSSNSNSNKRSVKELFGDIDDLDFNDEFTENGISRSKRFRLEEVHTVIEQDKDLLMIEKILEHRKKHQNQNKSSNNLDLDVQGNLELKQSDVTLCRRVPKYAFVTLRNGKNEKFYVKLHSEEALNMKIASNSEQSKAFRLLAIPFENIMAEANAIVDKKCAAEDRVRSVQIEETHVQKPDETELWVEKYKPQSYLDLLSDEGTNRILLQWLKLWDKVVFNRESKIKVDSHAKHEKSRFTKWNVLQLDEELDESGCPKHKIALLCGPPGLGKTTLAHVIAKHAGYNAVEMNASDDRSPEIFRNQLEAATQMQAVLGKSPKPNCLILDEIDGAPAASIDVLLKFVKGELKSRGKKGKGKQTSTLRRPIICICNDVYVPALRPLRQIAFVIHFPPTSMNRLAQRLMDICRAEGIKTDLGAMLALCEKTNNDIRTCLSTIYCLKNEQIRTSTIRNTNVGSKDMQKGLFTVWQDIFQIQQRSINHDTSDIPFEFDKNKSESELFQIKRLYYVLRSVQSNGDYDRLTQGVYENFLNVQINDSSMRNVSKGLNWFCFMDYLKTSIQISQVYTVMAYMPYCFVAWSFLFSSYQKPKLNYPNMMYEIITKQIKHSQIIQEVLKGMDVKIRAYCHQEQLLLDTLPLLTYLLNPAFRPVSIQLFTASEKEVLRQLVSTMIDYNLNFVQERTLDGSYEFNLDPNIDCVVEFPGVKKTKYLTYSMKLLISREIEQEKIRRLGDSLQKVDLNSEAPETPVNENSFSHHENFDLDTSAVEGKTQKSQNHLQKLTPKVIKKSPTSSFTKDFFGRIVQKPSTTHEITKSDEIVKSDVWFHFKEGFSNAVRRSVYIKDLL